MYRPFVDFAVEELSGRPDVSPLLLKEEFRNMIARDMSMATIDNKAFTSSKIRMFRIASIDTGPMQVLNVAGFARPEYDLPIFCADFFSVPNRNIVVLDLNPVYNTDSDKGYKERFYSDLLPLANKYVEEHPALHRPWLSFHPCGTSKMMALILSDCLRSKEALNRRPSLSSRDDNPSGTMAGNMPTLEPSPCSGQYLLAWLSIVGHVARLDLPLDLFKKLSSGTYCHAQ